MIYLLAIVFLFIYMVLVLVLAFHWQRIKSTGKAVDNTNFLTSILIPVRNESESIERLIHSIPKSKLPDNQLEILVIDDHSDDDTSEIIKKLMSDYNQLKLLTLPDGKQGKKAAISFGIDKAKGELILCTDGDCEVGEHWIDQHRAAYRAGAKLTFGAVELINEKKSRIVDMINLEQQALVAIGAVTVQLGKPSMINGCNYSFPKSVFEEVVGFDGNEHIPTGDDEFLLRKIHKVYPDQIQFLKSSEATVRTEPPEHVKQFYNQRKRWASKWRFHKDALSKWVPTFLFLCYLCWSTMVINLLGIKLLNLNSFSTLKYYFYLVFSVKLIVDGVYLYLVAKGLNSRLSLRSFILLQIIYPIYVVFFGLASNFGKYRWRERTYNI